MGVDDMVRPEYNMIASDTTSLDARRCGTDESNRNAELLRQVQHLTQKYAALEKEHTLALQRLDQVHKKLDRYKKSAKEWQKWYDRHPKYVSSVKDASPKPDGVPASTSLVKDKPADTVRESQAASREPAQHQGFGDDGRGNHSSTPIAEQCGPQEVTGQVKAGASAPESSQTTQAEAQSPETIANADSPMYYQMEEDDAPVVVSERIIKKSGRQQKRSLPDDGELASSSTLSQNSCGHKRSRQTRNDVPSSGATQPVKPEHFLSSQFNTAIVAFPAGLYPGASDLDMEDPGTAAPYRRQPVAIGQTPDFDTTRPGEQPVGVENDENMPPPGTSSSAVRHRHEQSPASTTTPRGILKERNRNTPTQALRMQAASSKRTRSVRTDSIPLRIQELAEEAPTKLGDQLQASKTKKYHRLNGLLEQNTKSQHVPLEPRTPSIGDDKLKRLSLDERDKHSSLAITPATGRLQQVRSPLRLSHSSDRHTDRVKGGSIQNTTPRIEGSLRKRPVSELSVNDFVINPNYAGSDFAYTAVVRGAARKCLRSCTKECCASLRKFAGLGDNATATDETELNAEEEEILREYMRRSPEPSMTLQQKRAIVRTVREENYMERYGRHKHVFERGNSPDGFWDTEMPSTQQLAASKEREAAMIREEVEVRWREALRGNGKGKYTFRDEVRR